MMEGLETPTPAIDKMICLSEKKQRKTSRVKRHSAPHNYIQEQINWKKKEAWKKENWIQEEEPSPIPELIQHRFTI